MKHKLMQVMCERESTTRLSGGSKESMGGTGRRGACIATELGRGWEERTNTAQEHMQEVPRGRGGVSSNQVNNDVDFVKVGIDSDGDLFVRSELRMASLTDDELKDTVNRVVQATSKVYDVVKQ